MCKTLRILGRDKGPIAFLSWCEGNFNVIECISEGLRGEFQKMFQYGLHEWVGDGRDAMPRSTLGSDPLFLPRVEDYLRRQTGFFFEPNDQCLIDELLKGLP